MAENADLRRLKYIRAAYKGHCTRNITTSETIMAEEEPNLEELETLLERVLTRKEAISVGDQKIETQGRRCRSGDRNPDCLGVQR